MGRAEEGMGWGSSAVTAGRCMEDSREMKNLIGMKKISKESKETQSETNLSSTKWNSWTVK